MECPFRGPSVHRFSQLQLTTRSCSPLANTYLLWVTQSGCRIQPGAASSGCSATVRNGSWLGASLLDRQARRGELAASPLSHNGHTKVPEARCAAARSATEPWTRGSTPLPERARGLTAEPGLAGRGASRGRGRRGACRPAFHRWTEMTAARRPPPRTAKVREERRGRAAASQRMRTAGDSVR